MIRSLMWVCLVAASGCSESLFGYIYPCQSSADCAAGYACYGVFGSFRCLEKEQGSQSSDGANSAEDGADGTDGVADGTDGTDGATGGPTLDLTEVTVSAYAKCVDAGDCTIPDLREDCNWGVAGRVQHPINCVDWSQATTYCKSTEGRLPTESEWKFAATNGGTTTEPWGSGAATCSVAVMNDGGGFGCGMDGTWEVCAKPGGNTKAGHCDMAGNVWEWTSTENGTNRVVRGGSWGDDVSLEGADGREVYFPSARWEHIGFRCLRD